MNISEGLNLLIESSQIDGKLSSKEREVIINKAENEGHNRDEFEIYLDGQFQLIKSESVFKKIFKWILKNKKTSTIIFVGFLAAFFIITYESTADIRGCEDGDDCIAKNKFNEARLYNNEDYESSSWWGALHGVRVYDLQDFEEFEKKIINAQINYFLINKAYQQAYVLIADYTIKKSYYSDYNSDVIWFNEILERIIIECENDQELLRRVINIYRAKEVKDEKASKKSNRYVYNLDDSRKKELLKKYKLD